MEIALHTGQYDPKELEHLEAVLDSAIEEASRLGVSFDAPDEALWLRTRMATAIFGGAASGERDPDRLRTHAVATVLDGGVNSLFRSGTADERRSAAFPRSAVRW